MFKVFSHRIKNPFWVFIVATVVTVLVRFLLCLTVINPATGFYQPDALFAQLGFLALLAICAVKIAYTLLLQNKFAHVPYPQYNLAGSILLLVVAALILWDSFFTGFNEFMAIVGGYPINILETAFSVITILAGLSLLGLGFAGLMRKPTTGGGNLLSSVFILLWIVVVLVKTFLGYPIVYAISDNMLHVLALCAIVFLVVNFSKLICDVTAPKLSAKIAVFGYLSAYFGFTLVLTRLPLLYMNMVNPMVKAAQKSDLVLLFALACFGLITAMDATKHKEQ